MRMSISLSLYLLLLIYICNGYRLIETATTWNNGDSLCTSTFGDSVMASIDSPEDQIEIEEICNNKTSTTICWIGGSHTGTAANNNCVYSWNDGTTFDESVLTFVTGQYCSNDQYMCIAPESGYPTNAGLHECVGGGEQYFPICNEPSYVYIPCKE